MEKHKIQWLGWAFFMLSAITVFGGFRIDIHHHIDSKGELNLIVESPYDKALHIEHSGKYSSAKIQLDVQNHHSNY